MAVPTHSGAAQSTQLWFFDRLSPLRAGSAAFADMWEDQGQRIHFIYSEILGDVGRLMKDDRVGLEAAVELSLRHIELLLSGNEGTARKYHKEARKFFTLARYSGVVYLDEITPGLVEDYLWEASRHRGAVADVKSTTAANRQSILRLVFNHLRQLGLWTGPDLLGSTIKRTSGEGSRPATLDELQRLRTFAESGLFVTGRSVLLALAEAGATAEETALVRPEDVRGSILHIRGRAERQNPLTEWGTDRIRTFLARAVVTDGKPLCVEASSPPHLAAHSITVRLRKIVLDAGLGHQRGLTARSIRLGIARQILDTQGLEAAAKFLGDASLDATATSLDYRWWDC